MRELQYTPEHINKMTLPLIQCIVNSKPPEDKKLESMRDYQKVLDAEAEHEKNWMGH